MTTDKDDDPVEELLRVLSGGEGSERMKELARVLAAAEQRRQEGPPTRAEAREWLVGNKRDLPVAVNHFWRSGEAEQFVKELYAAGARRVVVENISYGDVDQWGGPYADSLIVELPDDGQARSSVIGLCNQHCMADPSTGTQFVDEGQPSLSLWWD